MMLMTVCSMQAVAGETIRVAVISDLHIGREADGHDGSVWLESALQDYRENLPDVDHGLVLGDLTQQGDAASLDKYIALRDASSISHWRELAGNHEYYNKGVTNFCSKIGSTAPSMMDLGTVVIFFISDEANSRQGEVKDESLKWLREKMEANKDKDLIVCSHQLVANTVRKSNEGVFILHPKKEIARLIEDFPVVLWMCGHEHHAPYSEDSVVEKNGTVFMNVASMNHAYKTGQSASWVLELNAGEKILIARRRNHDKKMFEPEYERRIPLRNAVQLKKVEESK